MVVDTIINVLAMLWLSIQLIRKMHMGSHLLFLSDQIIIEDQWYLVFALLSNETAQTYTWLLQTFLSNMQSKKPNSIIIYSDKAMAKAIKRVVLESVLTDCIVALGKKCTK